MARTKQAKTEAPETVQETREIQEICQAIQACATVPEAVLPPESAPAAREIVGPEDETELLGCQDADAAELKEGLLVEYAVAAEYGLRLRAEPSLTAAVIAELPCGAGVFGDAGPTENGWRQVSTGRLSGWMMGRYLEPLPERPSLGVEKLPYVTA